MFNRLLDFLEKSSMQNVATYLFLALSLFVPGWGYLHNTKSELLNFTNWLGLTNAVIHSVYYSTPIFILLLITILLDRVFLKNSKRSDENSNIRYLLLWSSITTIFSFMISITLYNLVSYKRSDLSLILWMYFIPFVALIFNMIHAGVASRKNNRF